ncbi:hypothetical protein CH296_10075 [Rhodococcus sp. 14-2496-1d]|uniref:hypothetical protein n=1 Tax=Rhodococcus sp. 14-2496-1d TaxID=2023146 RepID=UPI000B9BA449|nr:hypothetical protein [Rhodococcus sp. 14-2496-1d]OZF34128.1 hypothetical protein CH296_10075 [Rhodococcus sp. 14-2496-1d]
MADHNRNRDLPDDVSDLTLGFCVAVAMFLPSYFGATLITDALLGRVGLPLSPLALALLAPLPTPTGLDRGGPSMVVFVVVALLIVGIVIRGKLRGTA